MKYLAYIVSFYVVFLTIMPCMETHADKAISNTEQTQKHSDSSNSESDNCSPFCACAWCASPIVFQDYTLQFNSFEIFEKQIIEYKSSYISSLYSIIWQPPKLS